MAKVLKRRVRWPASNAVDVVGYKVYWVVGGGQIDYSSENFVQVPANVSQIAIPDQIPALADVEDDVTIGVSAIDDIGNESDVTSVTVPFDFAAPDAPANVVVEAF